MRAKVAQGVRRRFGAALRQALPQFVPDKESVLPQGWRCWRWSPFDDLHFFVVLVVHPQADEFSVECVWSSTPALPPVLDDLRVGAERGGFRLHALWAPRRAVGWVASPVSGSEDGIHPSGPALGQLGPVEEAVARVPELVADALDKLVAYGMPVFRQVADVRGRRLELGAVPGIPRVTPEVATALSQALGEKLAERLPQFEPAADASPPPGAWCWRWSAFDDLHFFLVLRPRRVLGDLVLVCAWNTDPVCPDTGGELETSGPSFLLHAFWAPGEPRAPDPDRSALPPVGEASRRMPRVVADALDKLTGYGSAVFREVAEQHGHMLGQR